MAHIAGLTDIQVCNKKSGQIIFKKQNVRKEKNGIFILQNRLNDMQKQPIYAQQTACFNIKTRLNVTQKATNQHVKGVLLQCKKR